MQNEIFNYFILLVFTFVTGNCSKGYIILYRIRGTIEKNRGKVKPENTFFNFQFSTFFKVIAEKFFLFP